MTDQCPFSTLVSIHSNSAALTGPGASIGTQWLVSNSFAVRSGQSFVIPANVKDGRLRQSLLPLM